MMMKSTRNWTVAEVRPRCWFLTAPIIDSVRHLPIFLPGGWSWWWWRWHWWWQWWRLRRLWWWLDDDWLCLLFFHHDHSYPTSNFNKRFNIECNCWEVIFPLDWVFLLYPSFHRVWGGNDLITVDFTWKLDDDHDNDVDNHGDDHYDQTDVDDPSLGGNHSIAIAITWNLYQTWMTAASYRNNYIFQFHLLSLLKLHKWRSINPSNRFYSWQKKEEEKDQ